MPMDREPTENDSDIGWMDGWMDGWMQMMDTQCMSPLMQEGLK